MKIKIKISQFLKISLQSDLSFTEHEVKTAFNQPADAVILRPQPHHRNASSQ